MISIAENSCSIVLNAGKNQFSMTQVAKKELECMNVNTNFYNKKKYFNEDSDENVMYL